MKKQCKMGVYPLSGRLAVTTYFRLDVFLSDLRRSYGLHDTQIRLLLFVAHNGSISATKAMRYLYGSDGGTNFRSVQFRLSRLRDKGFLYNKSGKWYLTPDGLDVLGLC